MNDYLHNTWKILQESLKERGIKIPEKTLNGKTYSHILPVKGEACFDYLKLSDNKIDQSLLDNLHKQFNHINSSQLLCYCVFSPFLDNNGHISETLGNIFGISIGKHAIGKFEYNDDVKWGNKPEDTQFDFYIHNSDDNKEYFFEIKFTESNFGKANVKDGDYHTEKAEFYRQQLVGVIEKNDGTEITDNDIFNHYQMLRNILRAKQSNHIVIFLTDKRNQGTYNCINKFRNTFKLIPTNRVLFKEWQTIKENWPNNIDMPFQFKCF